MTSNNTFILTIKHNVTQKKLFFIWNKKWKVFFQMSNPAYVWNLVNVHVQVYHLNMSGTLQNVTCPVYATVYTRQVTFYRVPEKQGYV